MPPTLALFLTIAFVVFLFRRDILERPNITRALWLPLIWTLLVGSRSVAQWLSALGVPIGGSIEEGNPTDAVVYFTLIISGPLSWHRLVNEAGWTHDEWRTWAVDAMQHLVMAR